MKIEKLEKIVKNIRGIEQVEHCPVRAKTKMAVIFRANGNERYGCILGVDDNMDIIEEDALYFISEAKKAVKSVKYPMWKKVLNVIKNEVF